MIITSSKLADLIISATLSFDELDEDSTIEELIEALNDNPNDICYIKEE